MSVETITEVETTLEVIPFEEPVNPNALAHLINPPGNSHIWCPGMSAQDVVDVARTLGLELKALCGYRFIPKFNPDKCDACSICLDIAGRIISEDG